MSGGAWRRRAASALVVATFAGSLSAAGDSSAGQSSSAWAAEAPVPYALRAIAGSSGTGDARNIAMEPSDLVFNEAGLFVRDHNVVRRVDPDTGQSQLWAGDGTTSDVTPQTEWQPIPGLPYPGAAVTKTLAERGPYRDANSAWLTIAAYPGDELLADEMGGSLQLVDATGRLSRRECCPQVDFDPVAADAAGDIFFGSGPSLSRWQPGAGTTVVAGNGSLPQYGACPEGPARSVPINVGINHGTIAVAPSGDVYFAEGYCVMRLSQADGTITRIAGTGSVGNSGDGGPARDASIGIVIALANDASGDLFLATPGDVREVTPDGTINTVAGTSQPALQPDGYVPDSQTGDGGSAAVPLIVAGIAVHGDRLYLSDAATHRVRVVSPILPGAAGSITSIAGDGYPPRGPYGASGFGLDGQPALHTQLDPSAAVRAPDGSLYVLSSPDSSIRSVGPSGLVSTIAGPDYSYGDAPLGDGGPARQAGLYSPESPAVDAQGRLFFVDRFSRVRMIDPSDGLIVTIAGGGDQTADGVKATDAQIATAHIALDTSGDVFIAEQDRIREVDTAGLIRTIAGGGNSTADGAPALATNISDAEGLALDSQGRLLYVDRGHALVRAVEQPGGPASTVVTVAGSPSGSAQGQSVAQGAVAAGTPIPDPVDLATSPDGTTFATFGCGVFAITPQGTLSSVLGDALCDGSSPDRIGSDRAVFGRQLGIAAEGSGGLLLTDPGGGRVYDVTQDRVLGAAGAVTATPLSGAAAVSWTIPAPDDDQSPPELTEVDLEPGHHTKTVWGDRSSTTITGLDNGTTYAVSVVVRNSAGDGAPAPPVSVTPRADPPGAPRDVRAQATTLAVIVRWLPPLDDGGAPVSGYHVVSAPGGNAVTVGANTRAVRVSPLASGQPVTFTVTALRGAVVGAASRMSNPAVPFAGSHFTVHLPPAGSAPIKVSPTARVRDVDLADATVTDTSAGKAVAVAVSCTGTSGVRVSCSADVVDQFALRPARPLASGHRYQVVLNPSGDRNPITDLHGWVLPRLSYSFVAPGSGAAPAVKSSETSSAQPAIAGQTASGHPPVGDLHVLTRAVIGTVTVQAGQTQRVQVLGRAGIPATGVGAVLVDVVGVQPSSAASFLAWSGTGGLPHQQSIAVPPGRTRSELTPLRPAADGTVSIFVAGSAMQVRLVAYGWFGAAGAAPGDHIRVDNPEQVLDQTITAQHRGFVDTSQLVPLGATAQLVQVTVDVVSSKGTVSVVPHTATPRSGTEDFDVSPGDSLSRTTVVPVSTVSQFCCGTAFDIVTTAASVSVRVDLVGVIGAEAAQTGDGEFTPLTPTIVYDTRNATNAPGRLAAGSPQAAQVSGSLGVPELGTRGLVLLVTSNRSTSVAALTVWPHGGAEPTAPTLVTAPGLNQTTVAVVPLGRHGGLDFGVSAGSTDVVVTVVGYLTMNGFHLSLREPSSAGAWLSSPFTSMAFSADGRDLYLADEAAPVVHDIDLDRGVELAPIALTSPASGLDLESDPRYLDADQPVPADWAGEAGASYTVRRVDTLARREIGTIYGPSTVGGGLIANLGDGTRLFNSEGSWLSASADRTTAVQAAVLASPSTISFYSERDEAFLPYFQGQNVPDFAVDAHADVVVINTTVDVRPGDGPTMTRPLQAVSPPSDIAGPVAVSADGAQGYVELRDGSVAVYRTLDGSLLSTMPLVAAPGSPYFPHGLGLGPGDHELAAFDRTGLTVATIR